jgi:hypothetical protein
LPPVFDHNYSVITIATNKLSYVQFALNCAQSVLLHNDIDIYIISNLTFPVPDPLQKRVKIVKATEEHAALGIGIKLYLDRYLQTENTLFIDSDCLCYDSLEPVFSAFNGKDVSVVGTIVNAAEWCGPDDAVVIENAFGIKKLPRFNGGIYFIAKTTIAENVFNFARDLAPQYDQMGFSRLKNKWINEEILIAIAMMVYHQTPITDNGTFMTDLYTDHHPAVLNVLKGSRQLNNPQLGKLYHRPWYPIGSYSPVILHFGGNNLYAFPYITQYALLKLKALKFGNSLSSILSGLFLKLPYQLYRNGKKIINQSTE